MATVSDVDDSYRSGFFLTRFFPDAERQMPIIDINKPNTGIIKPKILHTIALTLWGADSFAPKLDSFAVGTPHFGHTTAWSLISAPQLLQYILKLHFAFQPLKCDLTK